MGAEVKSRGQNRSEYSLQKAKLEMIELIKQRGISDEKVLNAMLKIPRHLFVDQELWEMAYGDHPLPIGEGQTISQPYIVALMTEALDLQKTDKVLEIGTGSGYQTAILAELAGSVFTVERSEVLAQKARRLLDSTSFKNISFHIGDGTLGWEEHAPYDKIIATGSVPRAPESLLRQLKDPGRLVIPVGGRQIQMLLLIKQEGGKVCQQELCSCSFLPLLGKEGWQEEEYYREA